MAIEYPTYKPTYSSVPATNNTAVEPTTTTTYGGYSTVATGGTTTYGEGSAINEESNIIGQNNSPARGPHRTVGGMKEPTPVGSPMVMLLFAAAACSAIYFRRRKSQA